MVQKVVSVVEMTYMYGVVGSFVLLRLKDRVKLLTQTAENRICMGKLAFESLAKLFLKNEKTPDVQIFQGVDLLPMPSIKTS